MGKSIDPYPPSGQVRRLLPRSVVDAVIKYSRQSGRDPGEVLDEAFGVIKHLVWSGFLTQTSSPRSIPIKPLLAAWKRTRFYIARESFTAICIWAICWSMARVFSGSSTSVWRAVATSSRILVAGMRNSDGGDQRRPGNGRAVALMR
jgi:hypothetical protein